MLEPGTQLGVYEILSPIGAGGMGEVYKARDTRLNRPVAIKLVSEEFRDRFEREARAIAALNHPHVCHLYDVGPNYLVMEYVDGAAVVPPDSTKKLLDLAVQIADGLAAAHAAGIIHRDLKPANILVTHPAAEHPNQVKVLDFGIAIDRRPPSETQADTPTLTARGTAPGTIVGTAAYMSPEQARGETLSPQSDQFSLGIVLHELASRRHPFARATVPETMTAVIREDAAPLPHSVPAPLRWIIERLLSKDPGDRYDSTRDLYRELRQLRERITDTAQAPAGAVPARGSRWLIAVGTAVAFAAIGALIAVLVQQPRAPAPAERPLFSLGVELENALAPPQFNFDVSPDGTRVAYVARGPGGSYIALRSLTDGTTVAVPGAEFAHTPFFSPDGRWLAFTNGRKLMKTLVAGGPVVDLGEASIVTGASWGEGGFIVAAFGSPAHVPTQAPLALFPDGGGTPQPLASFTENEATHRWPQFLPGGEHVVFTAHRLLDTFDDANIRVVSVKTGAVKTIVRGGYFGRYLPSGHLVYMRGGVLYGVRFDRDTLEVSGSPVALSREVAFNTAWGTAQFDFSNNGTLIHRRPVVSNWPLAWIDAAGTLQPVALRPGTLYGPRISPDGTAIAYSGPISNGDIRVYEWERDKVTEVTGDAQGHFSPVWTPDGKHLVYRTYVQATGEFALDWARADGGGDPQRLLTSRLPVLPGDISAAGDLVYVQGESGYDIWTLRLDLTDPERPKAGAPVPFLVSPANELQPVFSPDGKWLAYVSNASPQGRVVMVRPFTTSGATPERRWQVSGPGSSDFPVWSRNGDLFYSRYSSMEPTVREIVKVPYRVTGDTFVADKPIPWSKQAHLDLDQFRSLDASPDGSRFIAAPSVDPAGMQRWRTNMTVLLNFFDDVSRRIP